MSLVDVQSPPPDLRPDPKRPPTEVAGWEVEGFIGEDGELYERCVELGTGRVKWLHVEG